ncbi:spermidine synthase [Polyangium spumosum]|uniref:PABS domain-containing protein n=1 Tax=Polyangium spumosum TaxID=889282 RepID=A0A6N7PMD8_9BACT|nr:hypothetical protein [Polyangium spumosum]MRG93168.1 hypothetical protein [Polyangium spumosum]
MRRAKYPPTAPALVQATLALTLLACDTPREPSRSPAPSPPPKVASQKPTPAPPPGATLPPGVRAEVQGKTGIVRVVEQDGFRLLTIDDTVHAAHFVGPGDAPLAAYDPLVSILVSARHEHPGHALVIGLGSGATAAELASVGFEVEVAEEDPAVIDVARRFFDYQGHAEVIDGLEKVRHCGCEYDLILVDAFAGHDLPPSFLDANAMFNFGLHLPPQGVLAVRLLGSPRDDAVVAAVRAFAGAFKHVRLYGTGAADEPQNLYLLLSHTPLRLFDEDLGLAFPLPLPAPEAAPAARTSRAEARRDVALGRMERRASLVGYLVRGEDGSFCLDLPHWEMGARRFVLTGSEATSLAKLLPTKVDFPTQGDLSTDGDVSGTLHSLLGGGGVKLSTVRFSPVVVAVEGKLSRRKPETSGDPRDVPRGAFNPGAFMASAKKITANAQGELLVEKVHLTLTTAEWRVFRQKTLKPLAARAAAALAKADFVAAEKDIRGMLDALDQRFGRFAPRMVTYDELATLLRVLVPPASGADEDPAARAEACNDARRRYRIGYGGPAWPTEGERREVSRMLVALFECAAKNYEQAAGKSPSSPRERALARSLVELFEDAGWDEFDDKKREALAKRAEELRKKWPLEPEPPPIPR